MQLNKGFVDRTVPEGQRKVSDRQIAWFDRLDEAGLISAPFNTRLFTNADSRDPELAGLWGAISGSFLTLVICLALSFPVGVAAAIYLEEFAPKNKVTDLIEVNINNMAAIPSIIFGLLGLAVFIQVFGLPRSAPLVGGMVLVADDSSDDHHRCPRGDEIGAALDPRGGVRHGRVAVAGRRAPCPAAGDAGRSHGPPSSAWRERSANRRRC